MTINASGVNFTIDRFMMSAQGFPNATGADHAAAFATAATDIGTGSSQFGYCAHVGIFDLLNGSCPITNITTPIQVIQVIQNTFGASLTSSHAILYILLIAIPIAAIVLFNKDNQNSRNIKRGVPTDE